MFVVALIDKVSCNHKSANDNSGTQFAVALHTLTEPSKIVEPLTFLGLAVDMPNRVV
jgi:hypothetical protein